MAGFLLGGGYSWKTSQFGLAMDNIQAYELVLPNGTVTNVTSEGNSDLFFGLKVTTFVLVLFSHQHLSDKTFDRADSIILLVILTERLHA